MFRNHTVFLCLCVVNRETVFVARGVPPPLFALLPKGSHIYFAFACARNSDGGSRRNRRRCGGGVGSSMSLRRKTFVLALAAALAFALAGDALARPGQSLSLGSRGTRTYSAPAPTPTNPNGASPFSRSMAPSPNQGIFRPGVSRSPGLFGGGLMGGL